MSAIPASTARQAIEPVTVPVVAAREVAADQRLEALDFVKGVLVVTMVVYHWLNYFIGLQWGGYRYLRFLTPAFICISGYLISRVYLARYSADDPQLRRRLFGRGLKLLALFLALNVLIDWTLGGARIFNAYHSSNVLPWLAAVFVQGRGGVAAFDILVSIAYFLLLAPVVLRVSKWLSLPLAAIAGVAVAAATVAGFEGQLNPYLEILPVAFVGVAAGTHAASRIGSPFASPAVLLPAYLIYLAAVAAWNVSYPLLIVGVALNLLLMAMIARYWGTSGAVQQYLVRLGQYSLLAYIAQIAVLQFLRRALHPQLLNDFGRLSVFAAALVLTVLAVEVVRLLRGKSSAFNRIYRAIFA